MRCGVVRPGDDGPWSDICVSTECDGASHHWIPIGGDR